jgi:ElaB/YqjD/DUF883 family membrane-anchored ribosome-binding protein
MLVEANKFGATNMSTEDEINSTESLTTAKKAAEKADRALQDTAQKFLKRRGIEVDLRQIEKSIHDKPLSAAAVAATAGFIVGGGLATRPAIALLFLLGRMAAKETAVNLVAGMVRS